MKKVVLLFLFLLSASLIKAQGTIGTYSMSYYNRTYAIETSAVKNNSFTYFIHTHSKYTNSGEVFCIVFENNEAALFKSRMNQVKEKFAEWADVAIKNEVRNYKKNIDVNFPKYRFGYKCNYCKNFEWGTFAMNKPVFFVDNNGVPQVVFIGTDLRTSENSQANYEMVFKTTEEIDGLLKMLNPNDVISNSQVKKQTDDLFK